MIRYALRCAEGHDFESWFPSSASYDAQRSRGLVACPACGSTQVEKAMMAPAVARAERPAPAPAAASEPVSAPASAPALADAPHHVALVAALRELRAHVVKTADYVGDDFARLAREMHEGEAAHRPIYGEASPEEVRALREDEIEVLPLPALPEDRN